MGHGLDLPRLLFHTLPTRFAIMGSYTFRIMGSYKGTGAEEIDTANDRATADYLLGEYRLAYGAGWSLWIIGG
jgi:hypothetical protein